MSSPQASLNPDYDESQFCQELVATNPTPPSIPSPLGSASNPPSADKQVDDGEQSTIGHVQEVEALGKKSDAEPPKKKRKRSSSCKVKLAASPAAQSLSAFSLPGSSVPAAYSMLSIEEMNAMHAKSSEFLDGQLTPESIGGDEGDYPASYGSWLQATGCEPVHGRLPSLQECGLMLTSMDAMLKKTDVQTPVPPPSPKARPKGKPRSKKAATAQSSSSAKTTPTGKVHASPKTTTATDTDTDMPITTMSTTTAGHRDLIEMISVSQVQGGPMLPAEPMSTVPHTSGMHASAVSSNPQSSATSMHMTMSEASNGQASRNIPQLPSSSGLPPSTRAISTPTSSQMIPASDRTQPQSQPGTVSYYPQAAGILNRDPLLDGFNTAGVPYTYGDPYSTGGGGASPTPPHLPEVPAPPEFPDLVDSPAEISSPECFQAFMTKANAVAAAHASKVAFSKCQRVLISRPDGSRFNTLDRAVRNELRRRVSNTLTRVV